MSSEQSPSSKHADVDGQRINVASQAEALDAIVSAAAQGQAFNVFTLNLDHLVKLRQDPAFRAAYSKATLVTADGAPVAMLARRQWPEVERTTGADLFIPLCEAAAKSNLPVFLFGTEDAVLDTVAQRLAHDTAGQISIAGTEAPPRDFRPDSAEADAALDRIRDSGARICFVMLGAPKQELFAARALERGIPCGFVCVGAAADFLTGHQIRAPQLFQKLGIEWLWRLGSHPRRLGMRYARCAVLFAQLLAADAKNTFQGQPGSGR
ncbi:WecB/TagA/CpsF family glycosyltransferase [Methyloceanibacter sp. wino2]|uniref:WecB/TagA/CpsF family glycosyltransferase n=1 Tax=Methyloceanibacter sp. wino2 TaxID=2170729 RepID=UPI000D3E7518|nr:WecB/TagA/CpsF family glycosyltransferase [Methyloceanibacter sp. wino2]